MIELVIGLGGLVSNLFLASETLKLGITNFFTVGCGLLLPVPLPSPPELLPESRPLPVEDVLVSKFCISSAVF